MAEADFKWNDPCVLIMQFLAEEEQE